MGVCANGGLMKFPDESYPRHARPARSDPEPVILSGLPDRTMFPASGPERRPDLPPCATKLTGRKCGKRVVHKYPDGWHCVSCGIRREVSDG